jgi:predicted phage terminase large subunit-like protein
MSLEEMLAKLPLHEQEGLLAQVSEYKSALEREKAQSSFMAYVKMMWPGFVHGRHHAVMAKKFEAIANGTLKRLIINMAPRHAIMLDMQIPTLAGWKTMADLTVGDYVFGPDGIPTEVLGKSEVFHDREIYRVTTDDGFSLDVDGEHLWTVRLHRKHDVYNDFTTEELWRRQNGELLRMGRGGKTHFLAGKSENPRLPRLPDIEPACYEPKQLLIHPYVLGVWLGDGHKNQGIITCKEDDQAGIRPMFESLGYRTTNQATPMTFGILGLKQKLRELGVLGSKHIPEQYLTSSTDQRRWLLKGLMDTDGNVSKAGQCFFAQSNLAIINQVRELLASLGIKNSLNSTEAKIGDKSYGETWRIGFYASNIAHLDRKEIRTIKHKPKFGRYIKIKKLEQTGSTQCIRVARPDGLFLAGEGYICTHNTKSEFASYLLPSWFLGKYPGKKIIQSSNTSDLAVNFGRKVRNLVGSEQYSTVFPNVSLRQDSKSAGRWATNQNGEYFAIGVGGTVTGKGADLLIIDDPHSEQEAAMASGNADVFDKTYEWYTSGPRQRLQPGGAIVIVMTRWGDRDLTGRIIKDSVMRGKGEEWEVVEFPAIMPSGSPLWPEFWSLEELLALKEELPPVKWNAQYQQSPTGEEGALVKRDWWQVWQKENPPACEFVIQSWDTAFTKSERSDFSACTTWGVFHLNDDPNDVNVILLDAFQKRMEFPELKEKAYAHYMDWEPDAFVVEAKAAGTPLIFELRRMGLVVSEYTPSRGNDKFVRLNSVTDLFRSGKVWAPETRWAQEVIEQMASFPNGSHDDLVDSSTQALIRFRQGGFIRLNTDEKEDTITFPRKASYY